MVLIMELFFKIKNEIKQISNDFFKNNKIDKTIFLDEKSHKKLIENKIKKKNKFNHFTLENLNHNVGDKILITKIIQKTKDKIIYDFKNSVVVKCVSKKKNHNYYNLKKENFDFSNFQNIENLITLIKSQYKELGNDVLKLGINFTSFKLLNDLEKLEKDILENELDKNIINMSKNMYKNEISSKIKKENETKIKILKKNETDSIRGGFGDAMFELGKINKNVVVLTADLKGSLCLNKFEESYPNKFFEMGIMEQNMASCASGMCINGKIPFITSFACFSPMRNLDQIRVGIAYSKNNVKIIGGHSGLLTGEDGGTHQALEDISVMRTLPNIEVIVPCDYNQTYNSTIEISKTKTPTYLRLSREKVKSITKKNDKFEIGKIDILYEKGYDLIIVACGIGCQISLESVKLLEKENIEVTILNSHTIKPFDKKTLLKFREKCDNFITIEEHQIIGGLGSVVCETLSEFNPAFVERIGMVDKFGESGKGFELLEKFNISKEEILKRAKKLLK